MPEKVEVEVFIAQGDQNPATRATLDKSLMLGLKTTVHTMTEVQRSGFIRRGYRITPIVAVWVGDGRSRVRMFMWDGFKPRMLDIAARMQEAGAVDARTQ